MSRQDCGVLYPLADSTVTPILRPGDKGWGTRQISTPAMPSMHCDPPGHPHAGAQLYDVVLAVPEGSGSPNVLSRLTALPSHLG